MNDATLEKIARFFLKYTENEVTDLDTVKNYIQTHFDNKTAFVGFDDDNEVTFICRWNISQDGLTCECLDLHIREDWRNKDIIRQLIKRGLWLFPQVKFIGWERGKRNHDRGIRYYDIYKLLGGNNGK